MTDKTQPYSNSDNSNKTHTYQADPTRTYADTADNVTRVYNQHEQRVTTTAHNLSVGDPITLNDKTYTITEIISEETGEAVIYKIQDQQDKVLALKLYNPKEEPNPDALQQIQEITDPDILRLYDYGTSSNKYQGKYCFEICEFAKGGNLLAQQEYSSEFIKKTIIPQIFKGIRTLHDHKIYHCDLKPQNIFWLDAERTDLVIGDYGSAKTFKDRTKDLRHTTTLKGTNFYLAPEQARGVVSVKNDYYSLGMIVLHLLYPQYYDNREKYLHKIVERQYKRRPIIDDYDPKYGELNDFIAGLTLADISARWGETQVRQWLWGEKVPVIYTTDAEVHPIKVGKTTIRRQEDLIHYIENTVNWHENLIEDTQGYNQFLQWVADVRDVEQKKVFDKMIKPYRQDGEGFLKQAVIRYFAPDRPVQVDMKVYDFWNAPNLEDVVKQCFQHLEDIWKITTIGKMKFYLFQVDQETEPIFFVITLVILLVVM